MARVSTGEVNSTTPSKITGNTLDALPHKDSLRGCDPPKDMANFRHISNVSTQNTYAATPHNSNCMSYLRARIIFTPEWLMPHVLYQPLTGLKTRKLGRGKGGEQIIFLGNNRIQAHMEIIVKSNSPHTFQGHLRRQAFHLGTFHSYIKWCRKQKEIKPLILINLEEAAGVRPRRLGKENTGPCTYLQYYLLDIYYQ